MEIISKDTWRDSILEEIKIHVTEIHEFLNAPQNFRSPKDSIESYVNGLPNFVSWQNLPSTTISNINNLFDYLSEYGEKIGFIDSGLLFKKGKSGVLFCENGIVIKTVMGLDCPGVDFRTLCSSIIEDTGKYIISDNKFTVEKEDTFTVIDTTSVMIERFITIRKILLSCSESHRECFCTLLRNATNSLLASIKNDIDYAKVLTERIYRFTSNADPILLAEANILQTLTLLYSEDFDRAQKYTFSAEQNELSEFVEKKISEFNRIVAFDLYEEAKKNFENKDYSASLNKALESVQKYATAESYELAFESIYTSANEDNQYNHDYLVSLMENNYVGAELKHSVLAKEGARISELEEKHENFIKMLGDKILDKILNNDIAFFENNPQFVNTPDKYGMNAIMYAILYKKEELYNALQNLFFQNTQTNILGHTINDIATFSYGIEDEMLIEIWQNHNPSCKNLEKSHNTNLKINKAKRKALELTISMAKEAISNPNYEGDWIKAGTNIKDAETKIRELNETIENSKEIFQKEFQELYNESRLKIFDSMRIFSKPEKSASTDEELFAQKIPKPLKISEYENESAFIDSLEIKKNDFIKIYVRNNLKPKGEFEKTSQFEERKENIYVEAEKEFEINIASHRQKCYEEYVTEFNQKIKTEQINKQAAQIEAKNNNLKIELTKIYLDSLLQKQQVKLASYDADNERFAIRYNKFTALISVPIQFAEEFKKQYTENGFLDFIIDSSPIHTKHITYECRAKFKDMYFPFNLKIKISS